MDQSDTSLTQSESGIFKSSSSGQSRAAIRLGISLAFSFLGFVSLKASTFIDALLCAAFPGICRPSAECPGGVDQCPGDLRAGLMLGILLFGPEIAFAIAAFVFSGKRRKLFEWSGLAL